MSNTSKKLVAREFLILLSSVILFLIISSIFLFIDSKRTESLEQYQTELAHLKSTDRLPYRLKIAFILGENWEGYEHDQRRIIQKLKSNINLDKVYAALVENKLIFITFREFKKNINSDKDSERYLSEIELLETNIEAKEYQINENKDFIQQLGISLLLIIYPLRMLFYTTKWSIKTLKHEKGQS